MHQVLPAPRAAFSRPRSQFFNIRTSQPAKNIYSFLVTKKRKQLSLTLLFKQGLTLRTSSIHCCQSSDRWHNIDQRSLTVSICRLRFCAMRDRGESLGSSADLSVSYSSITLRPESRARSTTNRLTFSLPLNAWRKE